MNMGEDDKIKTTQMSDDEIDLNLVDTFPASDPPSWTLGSDHESISPEKKGSPENSDPG